MGVCKCAIVIRQRTIYIADIASTLKHTLPDYNKIGAHNSIQASLILISIDIRSGPCEV